MDPKTRDLLLLLFGGHRERGRGGRSSRGWRGRQHSVWRREQHDGWHGGQYSGWHGGQYNDWHGGQYNDWHGVQHSGWRSGQHAGWRGEQHTGCSTSRHYGSWRAGIGDAHCYNNNNEQFLTERNKISTEDKLLNMATEHMELKPAEICCCYKSSQFEKLQKEQENIMNEEYKCPI
ncbi:uncharacterized protein LOC119603924 [Lucilia sericata]|uniref:uncharacterized protein LOC119603924 n=1 Tax=Lucilia sericata TaxID=13632 RepID=UPI0018A80DFD|nr:uncharacterized protein LOC119603924 [Lucilia sericata]